VYTYHREIPHNPLSRTQHIANIRALLHKADALAPRHVAEEVPGEERDPVRDVARLALVGARHVPGLELFAQGAQVVVHDRFDLEGVAETVELLNGSHAL
jgi:hypothetical protein